jgi:hypothetical protein
MADEGAELLGWVHVVPRHHDLPCVAGRPIGFRRRLPAAAVAICGIRLETRGGTRGVQPAGSVVMVSVTARHICLSLVTITHTSIQSGKNILDRDTTNPPSPHGSSGRCRCQGRGAWCGFIMAGTLPGARPGVRTGNIFVAAAAGSLR